MRDQLPGYERAFVYPSHHESHAASAFIPSPFQDAAILTMDGVGEWATASIGVGRGNRIELLKELHFPHSLGLLFSAFTYFCGFRGGVRQPFPGVCECHAGRGNYFTLLLEERCPLE